MIPNTSRFRFDLNSNNYVYFFAGYYALRNIRPGYLPTFVQRSHFYARFPKGSELSIFNVIIFVLFVFFYAARQTIRKNNYE